MSQSLVVECSHLMLYSREKLLSLLNLFSPVSPKSMYAKTHFVLVLCVFLRLLDNSLLTVGTNF